jgi:hypothetical protein
MPRHARLLLLSSLLVAACTSPETRPVNGTAGTRGGAGTNGSAGSAGAGGTTATAGDNGQAGTFGAAGDGTAGTVAAAGTNGTAGDGAAGTVAAAGTNGAAGTVAAAGTNGAAGTAVDAAADAPVDAAPDAPVDVATDSGTDASVDARTDADSGTPVDAGTDVGTVGEYTNYCSPVHWTITANPTMVHGTDYPTNIIDGSNVTRWSTGGNQVAGQYIQIDLGGTASLTQVVLDDTDNAGDYPSGYNVGLSANGTTFTSVATGAPTTAVVTINFAAAQGRYLRVTQTGAAANYWSIDELRVACTIPGFNPDAGLVDPYDSTYWKATASVDNADSAKAIDGVPTTRWTTGANQAGGEYLTIDLGGPAMLSGVTLDSGGANDFPSGYKLELSTNGTTYTQAAVGAGVAGLTNITFARTTARYLRVTQTGVAVHYWSVYELTIKP